MTNFAEIYFHEQAFFLIIKCLLVHVHIRDLMKELKIFVTQLKYLITGNLIVKTLVQKKVDS